MTTPFSATDFQAQTGATPDQMARLTAYADTLEKWQKAINLVALGTLPELWQRHMLDSAQLVDLLPEPLESPGILVDMGSGAGFPALVIAALVPAGRWKIHLLESDGRKGAFLVEAARAMNLKLTPAVRPDPAADLILHTARIEAVDPFPADVVTARALAPLDKLLDMAHPFLQSTRNCGVCLFLKGKTVQEELTAAQKRWTIQVTPHSSLSDPEGRILEISGVAPRP